MRLIVSAALQMIWLRLMGVDLPQTIGSDAGVVFDLEIPYALIIG
jgi:hypothetical protein